VKTKTTLAKNFIPAIHFYGLNNQFHRWLFGDKPYFFGTEQPGQTAGFLRGDFGFSYLDKRPVWSKMKDALPWTLLLNLSVLFWPMWWLFHLVFGVLERKEVLPITWLPSYCS
jgi:ABC-type dipeptide/oligopeptide/nickel transport system permease component